MVDLPHHRNSGQQVRVPGAVSERLEDHAWKVCIRQRIAGSNPALSARLKRPPRGAFFICWGRVAWTKNVVPVVTKHLIAYLITAPPLALLATARKGISQYLPPMRCSCAFS